MHTQSLEDWRRKVDHQYEMDVLRRQIDQLVRRKTDAEHAVREANVTIERLTKRIDQLIMVSTLHL